MRGPLSLGNPCRHCEGTDTPAARPAASFLSEGNDDLRSPSCPIMEMSFPSDAQ